MMKIEQRKDEHKNRMKKEQNPVKIYTIISSQRTGAYFWAVTTSGGTRTVQQLYKPKTEVVHDFLCHITSMSG